MGIQKFKQRIRRLVLTGGERGDVSSGFPAPTSNDFRAAVLKFKQSLRRPVLMNGSLGDVSSGFPAPASDGADPVFPVFSIGLNLVAQQEGDTGATAFQFIVTRSESLQGLITVPWSVAGSGANPADAADFGGTFPSGVLSFGDGEGDKIITVNVVGDTSVETDEEFTVTIGTPSFGLIGNATAVGQITNDDIPPAPEFAISPSSVGHLEGDSGTTLFQYTVQRSVNTTGAASVDWAVTGSGANPANAADFGGTFPSGTVNFADGESSKTINILATGDTAVEQDEGFTVTLSNPSAGTITTATATGVIQNDDSAPSLANTALPTYTDNLDGTYTHNADDTWDGAVSISRYWMAGTAANGYFPVSGLTIDEADWDQLDLYAASEATDAGGNKLVVWSAAHVTTASQGGSTTILSQDFTGIADGTKLTTLGWTGRGSSTVTDRFQVTTSGGEKMATCTAGAHPAYTEHISVDTGVELHSVEFDRKNTSATNDANPIVSETADGQNFITGATVSANAIQLVRVIGGTSATDNWGWLVWSQTDYPEGTECIEFILIQGVDGKELQAWISKREANGTLTNRQQLGFGGFTASARYSAVNRKLIASGQSHNGSISSSGMAYLPVATTTWAGVHQRQTGLWDKITIKALSSPAGDTIYLPAAVDSMSNTGRRITGTGRYDGAAPASLEMAVVAGSTKKVLKNWTVVTGAPSGGAYSSYVEDLAAFEEADGGSVWVTVRDSADPLRVSATKTITLQTLQTVQPMKLGINEASAKRHQSIYLYQNLYPQCELRTTDNKYIFPPWEKDVTSGGGHGKYSTFTEVAGRLMVDPDGSFYKTATGLSTIRLMMPEYVPAAEEGVRVLTMPIGTTYLRCGPNLSSVSFNAGTGELTYTKLNSANSDGLSYIDFDFSALPNGTKITPTDWKQGASTSTIFGSIAITRIAEMSSVGSHYRAMSAMGANGADIRWDSGGPTGKRTRTTSPQRNASYLWTGGPGMSRMMSPAHVVEAAHLAGRLPWLNIPHDATDDYITAFANAVIAKQAALGTTARPRFELSNEPWNQRFTQHSDLRMEGSRRGYDLDANPLTATPRTIIQNKFPGDANSAVLAVAVNTGDQVQLAPNGIGWVVVQAKSDRPLGDTVFTGTTIGTLVTANYDLIADNTQTIAGWKRYYAQRIIEMKALIDAAFTTAGRALPDYVANFQTGTVASDTFFAHPGILDAIDSAATAPYSGGVNSQQNFTFTDNQLAAYGWGTAQKKALYDPTISAETAIANAIAAYDSASPQMNTLAVAQGVTLKHGLAALLKTNGYPKEKIRVETYEGGVNWDLGVVSSTWPELSAALYVPAHDTNAAYPLNYYAHDGSGIIYKCILAVTAGSGIAITDATYWAKATFAAGDVIRYEGGTVYAAKQAVPVDTLVTNTTYWGVPSNTTGGDPRPTGFFKALLRSSAAYNQLVDHYSKYKVSIGDEFCHFDRLGDPSTDLARSTNWSVLESEEDTEVVSGNINYQYKAINETVAALDA